MVSGIRPNFEGRIFVIRSDILPDILHFVGYIFNIRIFYGYPVDQISCPCLKKSLIENIFTILQKPNKHRHQAIYILYPTYCELSYRDKYCSLGRYCCSRVDAPSLHNSLYLSKNLHFSWQNLGDLQA